MFAVIDGVIGALVRGDSSVAVDPYVEVRDHFTIGLVVLVVLVVFHVRQNRCFVSQFPQLDPPLKLLAQLFSTKDESPAVSTLTESFSIRVIVGYGVLVSDGTGLLAEGQYTKGHRGY